MLKDWIRLRIIQIIIDALGIYGAFLAAYFLRVGILFSSDFPLSLFAGLSALATFTWIIFLIFTKYYRIPPRSKEREWYDIALIFVGGIIAIGFLIVTYFFPREILFSRMIGLYSFFFGCSFLLCSQSIVRYLLARRKKIEKNVYHTLIIGANRIAEQFIEAIQTDPYAPHKVIGVIDPYGITKSLKNAPILGKLNKLEEVCAQHHVTSIIQCDAFEHTLSCISFCEEHNIKFQFDPALRGIFEKNLRIREVAGVTTISFVKRDYEQRHKQWFYRVGDWVLRQVFDVD